MISELCGNEAFEAATLTHLKLPPFCFRDNDRLVPYFLILFAKVICKNRGKKIVRRAPITKATKEAAVGT
jgi:hypothetical protein